MELKVTYDKNIWRETYRVVDKIYCKRDCQHFHRDPFSDAYFYIDNFKEGNYYEIVDSGILYIEISGLNNIDKFYLYEELAHLDDNNNSAPRRFIGDYFLNEKGLRKLKLQKINLIK